MAGFWDDAEIISEYTRQQAIDDGVLVQISGPGLIEADWMPAMAQEAGFKFPVAMTCTAFNTVVAMNGAAERAGNDIKGRLWDVLYMLNHAIKASRTGGDTLLFKLYAVVDGRSIRPRLVTLKCVCGPGDDLEPVLTIMLPDED